MAFRPATPIGSGTGGSGKPKTSSIGVQGSAPEAGPAKTYTAPVGSKSEQQARYEETVQTIQSAQGGSSKEAAVQARALEAQNMYAKGAENKAIIESARQQRNETVMALSGDPRTEVLQTVKSSKTPYTPTPSNPQNVAYLNPNTRVNALDVTSTKISMSGSGGGFKNAEGKNIQANVNPFLGIQTKVSMPKEQGLGERISAYGERLKQQGKDQPTPLLGRLPASPTATAGSALKVVGGSITRAGEVKEYVKEKPIQAGAIAGIGFGIGVLGAIAPPAVVPVINYVGIGAAAGVTTYNVIKAPAGKKEEALGASATDIAVFGGLGYAGSKTVQSVKVFSTMLKPTVVEAKGVETKPLGSSEITGKGTLKGTTKGKELTGTFEVTPSTTVVQGKLGKEPFTIVERGGQVKTSMYGKTTLTKSPTTDLTIKQVKLTTSVTENIPSVTASAKSTFKGTGTSTRQGIGDFVQVRGDVTVKGTSTTTKTVELTPTQLAQRYSGQPLGQPTQSTTVKYTNALAPKIEPSARQFLETDFSQKSKYTYNYIEKPGVKIEKVQTPQEDIVLTFKELGKKGSLSSGRNFDVDFAGRYNVQPRTRTTPETSLNTEYATPKVGRVPDFGRLVSTLSISRSPTVITALVSLRDNSKVTGGSRNKALDSVFVAPSNKSFIGSQNTPKPDTTPNLISTPKINTVTTPKVDSPPKIDIFPPTTTTNFITTPEPRIPFVDVPTTPTFGFPLPITTPGGGLGSGKKFSFSSGKQKTKYTPSAFAVAFNIRGKESKGLSSTGLSLRPIRDKK